MSQHTPGPWTLEQEKHSAVLKAGRPLTCLGRVNTRTRDEKANARLIAAAPEMLELLYCLTGYVEARMETDGAAPREHAKMARERLGIVA